MDGNVFAVNDELLRKFDNLERRGSPRSKQAPPSPEGSATIDYLKKQVAHLKGQLAESEERAALEKSNSIFLKGQLQAAKKQLKRTTKVVTDMQAVSLYPTNSGHFLPAILTLTDTSDPSAALTILRSWKEVYSHAHSLHAKLTSALKLSN